MRSYFPVTSIRWNMLAVRRKRWECLIAVNLQKKLPGAAADDVGWAQDIGLVYGEFLSFRDG
jgi:hypothetical protein